MNLLANKEMDNVLPQGVYICYRTLTTWIGFSKRSYRRKEKCSVGTMDQGRLQDEYYEMVMEGC